MALRTLVLSGNALQSFKDDLAKNLFGITKKQAIERLVCIDCKKSMECFETNIECKEYYISGLCNSCFFKNAGG